MEGFLISPRGSKRHTKEAGKAKKRVKIGLPWRYNLVRTFRGRWFRGEEVGRIDRERCGPTPRRDENIYLLAGFGYIR